MGDHGVASVSVPRNPQGFTPEWLTTALAGRHPGVVVSTAEVAEIDKGTTTRIVLRLGYASGEGPERVFVKMQGSIDHRLVMGLLDMLYHEARIFGLSDRLPLEAPLVYATGIDKRRLQSLVLMEDLRLRGVTLNRATEPLDIAVVTRVVEMLAAMHGRYWEFRRETRPELAWVPTYRAFPGWALVGAAGTRRAQKHHAEAFEVLCAPHLRSWRALAQLWCRGITDIGRGPQTLLHGDTHIGNSYLLPDGRFGFLDWQLVCRGSWTHDVCYFFVSSLDIEDRRKHERDLLDLYVDALGSAGGRPPSHEEAWAAYRRSPAYGFPCWVATVGFGDYQQPDLAVTTAARFAAAYTDLETDAALRSAGL